MADLKSASGALLAVALLLAGANHASARDLPPLPRPVANNAVAMLPAHKGSVLYSFLGLGAGKTWRDTLALAYRLEPGAREWQRLPDVPGGAGRLAGTAVGLGRRV